MQSLKARKNELSDSNVQLKQLNSHSARIGQLPSFKSKIESSGLWPLKPTPLEIFQVNLGKMCNQTCKHCHVDAGPDRKEIMTRETMAQILTAIKISGASTVDLTGGAPEMNPDFRWFVEQLSGLQQKIIVRCNLTIILANPKYYDLPEFFARHKVQVVSSLPFFEQARTDSQRGNGVFNKSIEALKLLNAVGYGKSGTGLNLDLVYNPAGAFLPGPQKELEAQFKKALDEKFGIQFNSLFCITNMPISRYLEYLINSGNLDDYMEKLVSAYNPEAAKGVMCRNTISVGWDGFLYDCDFNQMLDLKVATKTQHVSEFNSAELSKRSISLNQHCFGCTAGQGSSCGGSVTE